MRYSITCAVALLILPMVAAAGGVYKWVDKDGKVHYSQTRPKETDASALKVSPPPPADAAAPSSGGASKCLSYECYAEMLKQDRLERERRYAQARAERDREFERERRQRGTTAPSASSGGSISDEYLRSLCRGGGQNATKTDCNDTAKLRRQFRELQEQQKKQYPRTGIIGNDKYGNPIYGPIYGP